MLPLCNLWLLTLNSHLWKTEQKQNEDRGRFEWLWESATAVQFQVRHLLLSTTQAGSQPARHTPSPQHSCANPKTPSKTLRWELLPPSSQFSFFDYFFPLPVVPSTQLSSVIVPPNSNTHTQMHRYACLNTHDSLLTWAFMSAWISGWENPPFLACASTHTHSHTGQHSCVLILGYQVWPSCLICLLERPVTFWEIE